MKIRRVKDFIMLFVQYTYKYIGAVLGPHLVKLLNDSKESTSVIFFFDRKDFSGTLQIQTRLLPFYRNPVYILSTLVNNMLSQM